MSGKIRINMVSNEQMKKRKLEIIINKLKSMNLKKDTQREILFLINKSNSHSKIDKLINKFTKTRKDFWTDYFELRVAYALRNYKPGYELNYGNKKPDFLIQLDGYNIYIELKRKDKSECETILFEGIEKMENEIIEIFDSKSSVKYFVEFYFKNIPISFTGNKLRDFLNSIPIKIKDIKTDEIKKGFKYLLWKESDSEIYIKIFKENDKWVLFKGGGGFSGNSTTYDVIKDMLFKLLSQFKSKKPADITIGIINPLIRRNNIFSTKRNIDIEDTKYMLENIFIGERLKNEPNRVVCPWFKELQETVDAIFLICSGDGIIIEPFDSEIFISALAENNKRKIIERIYKEFKSNYEIML